MTEPVKNTSGAGFAFEDRVGAWLAAALLAGRAVLGTELGPPTRIDFQLGADGRRLDDVLVTFGTRRWAASVKSNVQFTRRSAPADFVGRCWEDLDRGDLMGLVCAPLPSGAYADLQELVRLARYQDPDDLDGRIAAGAVGADRHALWGSFRGDGSPGLVLAQLRVLEADFEFTPSSREGEAVAWCEAALADGGRARDLWARLLQLVSEVRTAGGGITFALLVDRLDGFELTGLPAYNGDRAVLSELSERNLAGVRQSLAGELRLGRSEALAKLAAGTSEDRFVGLVGPSGVGKTALARAWAEGREVLWLRAEDLPSLYAPGRLRHPLLEVIAAWPRSPWVVVDGLDRAFGPEIFQAAAAFIRGFDGGLLVTAQQQEWRRVVDALESANARVAWRIVAVDLFREDELDRVYEVFPALRDLTLRSGLSDVLRNAKVLDVVTRRLAAGEPLAPLGEFHNEAAFAEWFVEGFGQSSGPDRLARTRALLTLAELQADRLEMVTPLIAVPDAVADHLDALVRDGVCASDASGVRFAHDLYGDWARHALLSSQRAAMPVYLAKRLSSPLWHRAVRLHATGLLGDISRWKEELERLAPGEPGLVHDLFMEAAVFAGEGALERLWPALEAEGGVLLRRLLGRFPHIATLPNPIVLSQFEKLEPELAIHAATLQRVPYWPLWLPMLRVLHRHAEKAVGQAGRHVAEVADAWLRWSDIRWPLRQEAAELALTCADHVFALRREQAYGMKDLAKAAWRAALAAITERPEAVERIAMTLCARTIDAAGVVEADDLDDPDAPDTRPDRDFRDLCLDTDALHIVIRERPGLAAEILVALLEPRTLPGPYGWQDLHDDRLGMERLTGWFVPSYARGPFVAFLRAAPEVAIDMIVRIVEAATERWAQEQAADAARAGDEQPYPLAFEDALAIELLDGETVLTRRGDSGVLTWHLGEAVVPPTLASALMALEKWLYDESDAGHDIAVRCGRLLHESGSVAMVGLLVSVGCRHPDLLAGPLLPILSSAEVLLWQQRWQLTTPVLLQMRLSPEPEWMRQIIKDWHNLEHRKANLQQLAFDVMLRGDGEPFKRFRQRWLAAVGVDGEPAALRFLAAKFDRNNWHPRTHESGVQYLEFVLPEDLRKESEAFQLDLAERQFWLTFPTRMRRVLDDQLDLPEEQVEAVWEQARPLLQHVPPDDVTRDGVVARDDAACGLAAVLILRHRAWLREHAEVEQWCTETLLVAIAAKRQPHLMDSELGGTDWGWDAFCADALPVLWAERPSDERLRRAVAQLAQHLHHGTIRRLFAACARVRDKLGTDFARLRHLAVTIAVARAHDRERVPEDLLRAATALQGLAAGVEAFVACSLAADTPRWATIAVPDIERRDRLDRGLDIEYLYAAHVWIPPLAEARDADELDDWLSFYTEALDEVVRRLRRDRDDRIDEAAGTPYTHDTSLLWALPERILQVDAARGRTLWEPLLALGSYAHHWVESFLSAWVRAGLAPDHVPPTFAARWAEMIAFTTTAKRWNGGSHDERAIRRHLLGLGERMPWAARHAALIETMAPQFERWAVRDLDDVYATENFARFLTSDAASPLLQDGLVWLADAKALTDHRSDRLQDPIESLAHRVLTRRQEIARASTPAGEALRALLRWLADRQSAVGLELLKRLSQLPP